MPDKVTTDEHVSTEQILEVLRFAAPGATWVARLSDELDLPFHVACNRKYIVAYTEIVRAVWRTSTAPGWESKPPIEEPELLWLSSRYGRQRQLAGIEFLKGSDDPWKFCSQCVLADCRARRLKRANLLLDAGQWSRFELTDAGRALLDRFTTPVAGAGTRADEGAPAVKRGDWLPKAMLEVQRHPTLPDCEIAERVQVHPATLSRNPEYRRAANLARSQPPPAGGFVKLGRDGQSDLEVRADDHPGKAQAFDNA